MVGVLAILATQFNGEYVPKGQVNLSGSVLEAHEHDRRSKSLGRGAYALQFGFGPGEVLLFGVRHTNDPADPQLARLLEAAKVLRPTIAFFEGRGAPRTGDSSTAVRASGEGAITMRISQNGGIPIFTLEPPRAVEIREARAEHGDRLVTLFLFLRVYFGDRRTGTVTEGAAELLLARRQSQYDLRGVFSNLKCVDAFWSTAGLGPGSWRDAPESVIWPGDERTALNSIANLVNQARDTHLLACLFDAAGRGERVLVTVGRSHVINLEPIVRATASRLDLPLTTKAPWDD